MPHLDVVLVPHGGAQRQQRGRRHQQRDLQGRGHRQAAQVAQWQASVLPEAARDCAGETRAAPEAVATWQEAQQPINTSLNS